MADNKVITIEIEAITVNDKFVNVTDSKGVKYGISKDKNPNLYNQAKDMTPGASITGEYFMWKDNHYLSEVKEGGSKSGGKSFAPKDKSFDAGIAAASATAQFFSLHKDISDEQITSKFKLFHKLIMETKTV